MSKEERHNQLLQVAEMIVKEQGTDALTLITLAKQAGVSKPVTYEHFTNREGLLVQLYQSYDDKVVQEIQKSIALDTPTIEVAARIVSTTYMNCVISGGLQYEAVVSALQAYLNHSDLQTRIRDYFINAYSDVFLPLTNDNNHALRLKLTAVFGVSEEIAKSVILHEVTHAEAVETLTKIIIAILKLK